MLALPLATVGRACVSGWGGSRTVCRGISLCAAGVAAAELVHRHQELPSECKVDDVFPLCARDEPL